MDLTNFWFSSGATGGGGDFSIGESLRFRGTQYLEWTPASAGNLRTWTWSGWIKRGPVDTDEEDIFGVEVSTGGVPSNSVRISNSGNADQIPFFSVYQGAGSDFGSEANGVARDPSAWYHFVAVWDTPNATESQRMRFYINGVQQPRDYGNNIPQNHDGTFNTTNVHRLSGSPAYNRLFEGYMADVYFIDGQALEPTDFGEYNNDGVWVPINYTGTYGTNGFHLTFADPNNLGLDTSGNGNNFTATGFDTAPVGIFSNDLFSVPSQDAVPTTGTNKDFGSTQAVWAFNNDDSNECVAAEDAGSWLVWTSETAITATNSVRVRTAAYGNIGINNISTGLTVADIFDIEVRWVDVSSFLTFPIDITSIAARGLQGQFNATLGGIEIDGVVLVDNNGVDYDSMQDSPTQNYGTINPVSLQGNASVTLIEDGNLYLNNTDASRTGDFNVSATQASIDDYYFEATINSTYDQSGRNAYVGIRTGLDVPYSSDNTVYLYGNGQIWAFGQQLQQIPVTLTTGDVVGVLYEPSQNQCTFFIDGTQAGNTISDTRFSQSLFVWFMNMATSFGGSGFKCYLNFGQQPWLHAPTGVTTETHSLQTQNLPDATIANGSDQFRALTGTGANILAIAQGTNNNGTNWNPDVNTGFTNGLWWIKDMVNVNQHQIGTSLTNNNQIIFSPDSPNAMDESPYITPTGNSIAWCWNAPDAFTPTGSNGLTNLSGRRNVDAGFSIVLASAQGLTGATYTHGLNKTPEFIIAKCRTNAFNWMVYHKDLTNAPNTQYYLNLNNNIAQTDLGSLTFNLTTAGSVTLGTSAALNRNGDTFVYYNWTSIPGYSAFGTYEGNGSADGPFIYTGFRPAFFMCKGRDKSSDWLIYDSTRGMDNPVIETLSPSLTAAEQTAAIAAIDFVSNGFKIRSTATGDVNGNNDVYLFCAFAENPFGGSNVSPANAR